MSKSILDVAKRADAFFMKRSPIHEAMRRLAYRWLALRPEKEIYEFLQYDFQQLCGRYGSVYGVKIAVPKLIRLPEGLSWGA